MALISLLGDGAMHPKASGVEIEKERETERERERDAHSLADILSTRGDIKWWVVSRLIYQSLYMFRSTGVDWSKKCYPIRGIGFI